MKVKVNCIIQDEMEIIPYTIPAMLDLPADEFIFVDGGSKDGTREFLEELKDPRVTIIDRAFTNCNDQRNRYLQELKEGDWCIYIDADEIMDRPSFKKMMVHADRHDLVLMRSWHFWHDFWHVAYGPVWDASYHWNRGFRFFDGCYLMEYAPFRGDHVLMTPNEELYIKEHRSVLIRNRIFHYAYTSSVKRHLTKRDFFFVTDDKFRMTREEYDKDDSWIQSGWYEGKNLDPIGVRPILANHPPIMKTHPLYNKLMIRDVPW